MTEPRSYRYILGIDPSKICTGWAIYDMESDLFTAVGHFDSYGAGMATTWASEMKENANRIDLCFMEEGFSRGMHTTKILAEVRGAFIEALGYRYNCQVLKIAVTSWRKELGLPQRGKPIMELLGIVTPLYAGRAGILTDDTLEAMGIALAGVQKLQRGEYEGL